MSSSNLAESEALSASTTRSRSRPTTGTHSMVPSGGCQLTVMIFSFTVGTEKDLVPGHFVSRRRVGFCVVVGRVECVDSTIFLRVHWHNMVARPIMTRLRTLRHKLRRFFLYDFLCWETREVLHHWIPRETQFFMSDRSILVNERGVIGPMRVCMVYNSSIWVNKSGGI